VETSAARLDDGLEERTAQRGHLVARLQRISAFGVVSGVGWLLDLGLFTALIHLRVAPAAANVLSASLAVTWVYGTSVRRIFRYGGLDVRRRFLAYAAAQVVIIAAASAAVGGLVRVTGMHPLLAKLLVTPATFVINYRVMAWLTASAVSGAPSAAQPLANPLPGSALAAPRPRILVFVPMYQCERQIGRVLDRLATHCRWWCDAVLVVDNRSQDRSVATAAAALAEHQLPGTVLLNDQNLNLGGSHKVAFAHALEHGFDWVVVVHGDDQAEPGDFSPLIAAGALATGDALLGSRFSRGSRRTGYAWHRTWGNHVFNALYSLASGRRVHDLGSGLNAFRVGCLRSFPYLQLNDDLTFNIHLLLSLIHHRAALRYVPISWRDEDQVSNVRLVRQARRTLGIAWGYFWGRGRYLLRAHARLASDAYRGTVVASVPVADQVMSATPVASAAAPGAAALPEPLVEPSR